MDTVVDFLLTRIYTDLFSRSRIEDNSEHIVQLDVADLWGLCL